MLHVVSCFEEVAFGVGHIEEPGTVSPKMGVRPFDRLFLRGGLSDRSLQGGHSAPDPLVSDLFVKGVLHLTWVELCVDEEIHHQHSVGGVAP